jgi:hypothetical protein
MIAWMVVPVSVEKRVVAEANKDIIPGRWHCVSIPGCVQCVSTLCIHSHTCSVFSEWSRIRYVRLVYFMLEQIHTTQ